MTTQDRAHWASNSGFLLATLGSAVGLGNVWRFSYVAGENGGGAFLLVYLVMVILVGMPLLLGEFALGRSTQRESAAAFDALAPGQPWRHLGLLGVVVAGVILAYYAVIAGWVVKYLALNLMGRAHEFAAPDYATGFGAFIARPLEPILWQAAVLAVAMAVVAAGVERGIEALSKLLMPVLALLLLALALHSITLPGFGRGVAFLLEPDWTALSRPGVYLAALGQAFFSIGLAMGVMVTYGSYASPQRRLPGAALTIAMGDTLFAIAAGLIIFPAVFSYGLDPAQGPVLAFVVLPEVFAQMRGGTWIGTAFFALLSIAALTSAVSLLEVTVAFVIRRRGWSRVRASLTLGSVIFALGIPASLGFGFWSELRDPAGRSILDAMDYLAANVLLPLNGVLIAVFLGWVWQRNDAMRACDLDQSRLGRLWYASLRYLVPILVAVVFVRGLVS